MREKEDGYLIKLTGITEGNLRKVNINQDIDELNAEISSIILGAGDREREQ